MIVGILRFTFITPGGMSKITKRTFGCLLELNVLYTTHWNVQLGSPSVKSLHIKSLVEDFVETISHYFIAYAL